MENAMKNTTGYESYMSESVYKKINPKARNMPNYDADYTVENHHYGTPFPLHIFGIARVSTNHTFDNQSMGFNERLILKLRLVKGKWYATEVSIKP